MLPGITSANVLNCRIIPFFQTKPGKRHNMQEKLHIFRQKGPMSPLRHRAGICKNLCCMEKPQSSGGARVGKARLVFDKDAK